jgi:hypothetical protein
MAIEDALEFSDFQAEYEGSIPFTRSKNDFNGLELNFSISFRRFG